MRRLLIVLAGSVGLSLAIACGGGDDGPPPTPSPQPAPTRTPRPARTPTPSPQPTSNVLARPTPHCPDPYPGGAPYQPAPGKSIHLRPTGSPAALAPYTPIEFERDPDLEAVLKYLIGKDDEHFSIIIKDLDSGEGAMIDPERVFYGASLYKTWVMLELFHQRDAGLLDFDEQYIVSDYYASLGLNAGEIEACERVSLVEALDAMMSYSDNVAANMLLDRAGVTNVNTAVRAFGLARSGFAGTDPPTSAADMALLLEAIARGSALSEDSSAEMILVLGSEVIDNRIPALLPPGTRVAHKTGSWSNATHDAGIVFSPAKTYVIVVLTDFGYAGRGAERIASLSRAVYDYYNRAPRPRS